MPTVHGWEDQRWPLPRIWVLIWWKFKVHCSSAAVWWLLHRHGWSWQSPARRALERGRGRVLDDTISGPYVQPAWAHAGCAGARQVLAPLFDRSPVLLQARRDIAADLPALPSPQASRPGTEKLRLDRLPRPDRGAHLQLGAPIVLI